MCKDMFFYSQSLRGFWRSANSWWAKTTSLRAPRATPRWRPLPSTTRRPRPKSRPPWSSRAAATGWRSLWNKTSFRFSEISSYQRRHHCNNTTNQPKILSFFEEKQQWRPTSDSVVMLVSWDFTIFEAQLKMNVKYLHWITTTATTTNISSQTHCLLFVLKGAWDETLLSNNNTRTHRAALKKFHDNMYASCRCVFQ